MHDNALEAKANCLKYAFVMQDREINAIIKVLWEGQRTIRCQYITDYTATINFVVLLQKF